MLKVLKTFYRFNLHSKPRFWLFIFIVIIAPLSDAILPYFYKLFVDAIPEKNYQRLVFLLMIYIIIYLLGRILDSLSNFVGDLVTFDANINARTAVFERIQDLDFAFHVTKSSGSLISIIKRGYGSFWDLHHSIHFRIIPVMINFLVMMCFFAKLNLTIFLIMGSSFFLAILVANKFIKLNIKTRGQFNEEEDQVTSVIVDNMVNFETVKLFAKENWERQRLAKKFIKWKKTLWDFALTFRYLDIVMAMVIISSIFFTLFFSLKATINDQFTPGDFVLVVGFTAAFYPKLFELIWGFRQIAKNYSDIQKYFGILDYQTQVKDPKKPEKINNIQGQITYHRVSFAYEKDEKDALKNVDLTIRPGQAVALVGRSGAGKTTLAKLLMRFFDPQAGSIEIDGVNIKNLVKSDLRSMMGVVPQEPVLFNHTIGYNIAYGRPGVPRREIESAAKMAHIHQFISQLPKGYLTRVGERGIKLSGGQKQRVAIARMILSNPQIVIFDEATSQLDSESEKYIQEAFWRAVRNKTTIIIAHRLSTVMRADKIIVMEKGKIVETGSHQALIKRKGSLYRHFWQLQKLE